MYLLYIKITTKVNITCIIKIAEKICVLKIVLFNKIDINIKIVENDQSNNKLD